jgi:hypothetical protein
MRKRRKKLLLRKLRNRDSRKRDKLNLDFREKKRRLLKLLP